MLMFLYMNMYYNAIKKNWIGIGLETSSTVTNGIVCNIVVCV